MNAKEILELAKRQEADHGSQWEHVARTQAKALEAIAKGELEL